MGTITLRLFPKQAPLAVANFKGLAAKGYYDGITFHRVIDGFMIQGGDPSGTGFHGQSVWGGTFKDEVTPSLRFDRPGLLAMANAGPGTNGSQFFITQTPQASLNDKHTIFGEVMEGMDVVNAIAKVRTDPERNQPMKPVVIESLTIVNQGN
jgi:peptidylprolyl isomerase